VQNRSASELICAPNALRLLTDSACFVQAAATTTGTPKATIGATKLAAGRDPARRRRHSAMSQQRPTTTNVGAHVVTFCRAARTKNDVAPATDLVSVAPSIRSMANGSAPSVKKSAAVSIMN